MDKKVILDFSNAKSDEYNFPIISDEKFIGKNAILFSNNSIKENKMFIKKANDSWTGYNYLQLSIYSKNPSHAVLCFQAFTEDTDINKTCYTYHFTVSWSGHKILTFPLFKGIVTNGSPKNGYEKITGYGFLQPFYCLPPTETEIALDGVWVTNDPLPDVKERFIEVDENTDYRVEGIKPQKYDAISLLKERFPNKSHPRLIASKEDFENIKGYVKTIPFMNEACKDALKKADNALNLPVICHELDDGRRLSRQALRNVPYLLIAYIISGDKKYKDRARDEVLSVCRFPDWNPAHDIDVGDMARPVALAYDWLYDEWTEEEKRIMRNGMLKNGMEAMINQLRQKKQFACNDTNHNTVTSSGLGLLGLAIGDEEGCEEISNEIINLTIEAIFLNLKTLSPRGVYTEGPIYWNYGQSNFYIYEASLIKALGTDFGMRDVKGLDTTGDYIISMTGNTGECFNYYDSNPGANVVAPSLMWLAQLYNRYDYAQFYLENKPQTYSYQDLIFFKEDMLSNNYLEKAPTDYFLGNIGNLRGSNTDSNSIYVGFKGGAKSCHMDLDFGSFVFETLGERWFVELGIEEYDMPGMWEYGKNAGRWNYYRKRAEGNNTIVINPYNSDCLADQNPNAVCDIIEFDSKADSAFCVVDLTTAYDNAKKVTRKFALLNNRTEFCICDEFDLEDDSEIYSFFHTKAQITVLDKNTVKLSQNGKAIIFSLSTNADAEILIMDCEPLRKEIQSKPHKDNSQYKKIAIYGKNIKNEKTIVTIKKYNCE